MEQKAALRLRLKEERALLSPHTTERWDKAIAQQVLSSVWFKQADIVFAYHSVGREVDTLAIMQAAHNVGKQVALPRCGQRGEMTFYLVQSSYDLAVGKYGIPEPGEYCPAAIATPNSVCLVPALAFDRQGYRIGYGGGYYDRFLAEFPGKSIGLVHRSFLVEGLPKEPFDLSVNALATEQGLIEL